MVFIDPAATQDLDDLRAFPLATEDVLVVGFVKSGTSWLQIMITNLFDHLNTCGGELRKVPSLHGRFRVEGRYYSYPDCLTLPPPRLMKTHLPRELHAGAVARARQGRAHHPQPQRRLRLAVPRAEEPVQKRARLADRRA